MIKGALARLLRYPNAAVFDKSPDAGIALRINHPGGLSWSVLDETLTIDIEAGRKVYDLGRYSIGSLVNRLKVDGISVAQVAPYFFGRSARVLLDGSGDASAPGGDTLLGFRSLLFATYAAYSTELRLAKSQVSEALRQMIITQSEGEWVDLWGALYGVSRDSLSDSQYQQRIPQEAFRLRVNKYAIENAILDVTGLRVFIREPWPSMFRLDESRLSGTHRLVDGEQWRYGYIQPTATSLFDWTGVLEVIERNKAAGVVVLPPLVEITSDVDGHLDGSTAFGILAAYGAFIPQSAEYRLDWMRLGDTYPHRNWRAGIDEFWGITNTISGGKWSNVGPGWPAQPWSYGRKADDLDGSIFHGIASELEPLSVIYGTPDFHVLDLGIKSNFLIGANFNRWTGVRTWARDTWASRGGPVPSKASVAMAEETLP